MIFGPPFSIKGGLLSQACLSVVCRQLGSCFTTAADRRRLDVFIRRSKRYGYCSPDALPVSELFDNADNALFRAIINNSSHILGHFLSIKSRNNYNTRHRKHNFELIKKTTSLGDRNFLTLARTGGGGFRPPSVFSQ